MIGPTNAILGAVHEGGSVVFLGCSTGDGMVAQQNLDMIQEGRPGINVGANKNDTEYDGANGADWKTVDLMWANK